MKKIRGANALENAIQANNNNNNKAGKGHKMLAVSIVRRANKQWRMLSHTSTKLQTSSFTNNQVNASTLPELRSTRGPNNFLSPPSTTSSQQIGRKNINNPAIDEVIRGLGTLAMKAKRAEDGTSEMVVTMNNDDDDSNEGVVGAEERIPAALKALVQRGMKKPKVIDEDKEDENEDDKKTNYDQDDDYSAEHSVNLGWPIPRQTVHALRELHSMDLITNEEKGLLIKQVVDGIASQDAAVDGGVGDAFVVTAYKTIFLDGLSSVYVTGIPERKMMIWSNTELEEFAQQCKVLLARLQKNN